MAAAPRERSPFLGLLPLPERNAVVQALRTETTGGLVLLAAAVVALVWANTPWSGTYEQIRDFHFGIPSLGLDLSVGHWTADGLLTLFFLVAGIELKREFVVGELRTPATAALPVIAAVCGMAVPAALYAVTAMAGGGSLEGWAVPMATDIAFALAVLAVLSTHLPAAPYGGSASRPGGTSAVEWRSRSCATTSGCSTRPSPTARPGGCCASPERAPR